MAQANSRAGKGNSVIARPGMVNTTSSPALSDGSRNDSAHIGGGSLPEHQVTYVFTIPFPPSANTLYRAFRGRNILSQKGREFYDQGQAALLPQKRPTVPLAGALEVTIMLCAPTRRGYDVDNRAKGVLDLLTKVGIWADDEQVVKLTIEKGPVLPGGAARVAVAVRE